MVYLEQPKNIIQTVYDQKKTLILAKRICKGKSRNGWRKGTLDENHISAMLLTDYSRSGVLLGRHWSPSTYSKFYGEMFLPTST
jgi:hypothetical protein